MRIFGIVAVTGIVGAVLALAIALAIGNREVGIALFKIGFFVGAFGVVGSLLSSPKVTSSGVRTSGLKLAAVGFGVIVLTALVELASPIAIPRGGDIVGSVVMAIGIAYHLLNVWRNKKN